MALKGFIPSTTGMQAYAHSLGQISTNIANISTVGYRTNETMFYTLLGANPVVKNNNAGISSSRVDIEGVGYYDRTNVLDQGQVSATGQPYDVAINGNENSFFLLKDAYGKDYYSRAGNFGTLTQNGVTYLVNQNGLKVQGFPSLNGKEEFGANTEDIIIKYPETLPAVPTTEAKIVANIPATGVDKTTIGLTIYGNNHEGETLHMIFNKVEGKVNTWTLSYDIDGGTASSAETEVVFDSSGNLVTPKNLSVNVAWSDGEGTDISIDMSKITQLSDVDVKTYIEQNGAPSGSFVKSFIGEDGIVKASYTNGEYYNCGKIALVGFTSPENLSPYEGTLFVANSETGETFYANDSSKLVAGAVEASTVDIETEFSRMILVQRAYSTNANAFTATNEMLQTAVDLKS